MNEEKFMKMVKWLTAGILLLVAFVVGVVIFIIYSFTAKDAASISVIGGADGPTSIYVSSGGNLVYLLICLTAAAVIAGVMGFVISKLKR